MWTKKKKVENGSICWKLILESSQSERNIKRVQFSQMFSCLLFILKKEVFNQMDKKNWKWRMAKKQDQRIEIVTKRRNNMEILLIKKKKKILKKKKKS